MSHLAAGWEEEVDPNTGRVFYVNHATKQTSWTPPVDTPLPSGWEERRDEQGRTFFLHVESNKTTWQDPRLAEQGSPGGLGAVSSAPSTSYPSLSSSTSAEPRYQLKTSSTAGNGSTWTCSQCTLSNPNSASSCQACDSPRPGAARGRGSSRDWPRARHQWTTGQPAH